ncbi:uncharacterized protein DUF4157 [Halohasta litchfieldiae]|jgi:hypothetical protein|uniref:eCIS core domain-containing protein n=1 Tax=Halohasta litchfieldiae TaxID=1073996 RepID=A0A1H6WTZ1_9EURY|nr:DUF4157 domain-containing protein [Halohasta litchfieldiae]ATW89170.1 uncharacterized protein DUF4157 [Halohasta litchfieldiae]SEJ20283.1 protein of unknown function [Halohasta litchfieldiae]
MGFRSSRRSQTQETDVAGQTARHRQSTTQQEFSTGAIWTTDTDRAEQHFGMQIPDDRILQRLQIAEDTHGPQVHDWIEEGMTAEILGKTWDMETFRQRQAERPSEVPTNIERQNKRSLQRSEKAAVDTGAAGETGVPEPVRDVISSTGRSLDASIQRAMEDRMGDSFGDVQIHTGSTAAAACESINARAFTVGSHIAFNQGEYDPESPEGQHVLAHELAHVRQQTGSTVSMLPQENVELEVDPDPALEREAEETAQQVMKGGALDIQRMSETEVHVQRAGLGSISRDETRSPGDRPEQPPQPTQSDQQPVDIDVDEIKADPETLADEVQQIKANQQLVMKTLTEAKPGATSAPGMDDLAQTAIKGASGSLVSAGAGAAIGTVLGGPIGTALGAGVGAVAGMASDLTKQGVDYAGDRLLDSQAQDLEQMYSEMTRMYKELKEGSDFSNLEGKAQSRSE